MNIKVATIVAALAVLAGPAAHAQTLRFDSAAYVTCREAQNLAPDARRALAVFLADHASHVRGVMIPDDQRGANIAMLVRGGCTLSPDSYLFAVIDRAILAEADKLPKR